MVLNSFKIAVFVATFMVLMQILDAQSVKKCISDDDCNHGKCLNFTCVCEKGYVSYKDGICSYQQKEKLTAFLLSILIGTTGADWFYLSVGNGGYIAAGVFKLLTGVAGIFLPCCICCFGFFRNENAIAVGAVLITVIITILAIANGAWWLADWIRILVGSFKDGNGVNLKDW